MRLDMNIGVLDQNGAIIAFAIETSSQTLRDESSRRP
jgi:hypothetical protein